MSVETAVQHSPVGFGRGRRTSRVAVIQPLTSDWMSVPSRIRQWPAEQDIDPWLRTALSGFLSASDQTAFYLLWHQWRKGQTAEEVVHSLFPDQADTAIILAPREEHAALYPLLESMEVPFVIAYARRPEPHYPWVACDNRGGVARVVQHLANLGHRRIAFLTGGGRVADFQERQQGYLDGMHALGLQADPSLIVEAGLRELASEIAPAATALLRRPDRPTAVVCATDVMALSVVEAAWQLGIRVPDDVAVVGFDDSDYAAQSIPPLTTVHQPILEIANRAGYLAVCAVTGQQPETGSWQIDLPTSLVVRESCGAAWTGRTSRRGSVSPPHRADAEGDTIRRQLEHHMRQLAATQSQMEQLLYVASHDLRAPLITIEGFATILERKCWDLLDLRGRDCVTRIRHSVANLGKLTDALLTLSRAHREQLSLTRTSVADVVDRVLRDLEVPIAERKVQVRVSSRLPIVLADETAFYRIFLNLVGNAVKFLGEQPHPAICISHRFRPDEHQFSVEDNGIGIAPEHQEMIFQLFRRGPDAQHTEGQGIGLSLVKNLVLRHGGRIWVESQKGHGATFHFTLPRGLLEPAA